MNKRKKLICSSEFKSDAITLALKQGYIIAKATTNLEMGENVPSRRDSANLWRLLTLMML
jgi:hypothetical protein